MLQASAKLSELQADDERRRSSQSLSELLEAAAAEHTGVETSGAGGECSANGTAGVVAGGVGADAGAARHAHAHAWHESMVDAAAVDVRASVAASSLADDEWHETLEPEADGDSARK